MYWFFRSLEVRYNEVLLYVKTSLLLTIIIR